MNVEKLVDLYGEELMGYLWRYLQFSYADAEDCLQETYLRALQGYSRLNHRENLRAWIYKIATNVANTHLSRKHKSREVDLPIEFSDQSIQVSVEDAVGMSMDLEAIASAVDRLPTKQKSAFLMRKYQMMSYEEIASSLECSPDTARANVYQAMRRLRAQFNREGEKREYEDLT